MDVFLKMVIIMFASGLLVAGLSIGYMYWQIDRNKKDL